MARKDLLKGLIGGSDEGETSPAPSGGPLPRRSTGAIGAVSRSIADLKSRSVVDVDPRMIDQAGLKDRLDNDDPDQAALEASIREYGQQVPVLLRVNPNDPERYQVVYGRRRVAALKALGQPVKAMIRDLDDRALILAQGQENAARKDLSFIEKANFARQLRDLGYERKIICDALAMDKTLLSRMLSIADRIPVDLIEAIGSAPSVGRDRWLVLADKIGPRDLTGAALGESSDARFEAVIAALAKPKPAAAPPDPAPHSAPQEIASQDGRALAKAKRSGAGTVLTINRKTAQGFDDWLVENLPQLHRDWQDRHGKT